MAIIIVPSKKQYVEVNQNQVKEFLEHWYGEKIFMNDNDKIDDHIDVNTCYNMNKINRKLETLYLYIVELKNFMSIFIEKSNFSNDDRETLLYIIDNIEFFRKTILEIKNINNEPTS